MFNQMFVFTTLFAALFMSIALKFMQLFSFIKWSPVGWAEKSNAISPLHPIVKWGLLFVALVVVFAILYLIVSYLNSIPAVIPSIFISIVAIIVLEWFISEPKTPMETMQSISIPLFAVIAMVMRFIVGTAVFHRELIRKV